MPRKGSSSSSGSRASRPSSLHPQPDAGATLAAAAAAAALDGSVAAAVGRAKTQPRTPEAARALCALAHQGELAMVKLLVEEYGVPPACRIEGGAQPLHVAAGAGRLGVLKYLVLECGGGQQEEDEEGAAGSCPCNHHGQGQGHCDGSGGGSGSEGEEEGHGLVGAEPSSHGEGSSSSNSPGGAATAAASSTSSLAAGAAAAAPAPAPVAEQPQSQQSQQQGAAAEDEDEEWRLFRVDVDAPTADGRTALHFALKGAHEACALFLAREGRCRVDARDAGGRSPLMWACCLGLVGVARCLVAERGADPRAVDGEGYDVASIAATGGGVEAVAFLVEEAGLGPGTVDDPGHNGAGARLLYIAARYGHLPLVRWLVERGGARVDARSTEAGVMAHHAAAAYGHVAVLRYLVKEAGAPVSAPAGEDRSTALHIAAEEGQLAAVQWVVEEAGADMHARDDYGRRPKEAAHRWAQEAVVTYFERRERQLARAARLQRQGQGSGSGGSGSSGEEETEEEKGDGAGGGAGRDGGRPTAAAATPAAAMPAARSSSFLPPAAHLDGGPAALEARIGAAYEEMRALVEGTEADANAILKGRPSWWAELVDALQRASQQSTWERESEHDRVGAVLRCLAAAGSAQNRQALTEMVLGGIEGQVRIILRCLKALETWQPRQDGGGGQPGDQREPPATSATPAAVHLPPRVLFYTSKWTLTLKELHQQMQKSLLHLNTLATDPAVAAVLQQPPFSEAGTTELLGAAAAAAAAACAAFSPADDVLVQQAVAVNTALAPFLQKDGRWWRRRSSSAAAAVEAVVVEAAYLDELLRHLEGGGSGCGVRTVKAACMQAWRVLHARSRTPLEDLLEPLETEFRDLNRALAALDPVEMTVAEEAQAYEGVLTPLEMVETECSLDDPEMLSCVLGVRETLAETCSLLWVEAKALSGDIIERCEMMRVGLTERLLDIRNPRAWLLVPGLMRAMDGPDPVEGVLRALAYLRAALARFLGSPPRDEVDVWGYESAVWVLSGIGPSGHRLLHEAEWVMLELHTRHPRNQDEHRQFLASAALAASRKRREWATWDASRVTKAARSVHRGMAMAIMVARGRGRRGGGQELVAAERLQRLFSEEVTTARSAELGSGYWALGLTVALSELSDPGVLTAPPFSVDFLLETFGQMLVQPGNDKIKSIRALLATRSLRSARGMGGRQRGQDGDGEGVGIGGGDGGEAGEEQEEEEGGHEEGEEEDPDAAARRARRNQKRRAKEKKARERRQQAAAAAAAEAAAAAAAEAAAAAAAAVQEEQDEEDEEESKAEPAAATAPSSSSLAPPPPPPAAAAAATPTACPAPAAALPAAAAAAAVPAPAAAAPLPAAATGVGGDDKEEEQQQEVEALSTSFAAAATLLASPLTSLDDHGDGSDGSDEEGLGEEDETLGFGSDEALAEFLAEGAAEDFICPISLSLMRDPVFGLDGLTYDRKAIQEHIDFCLGRGKPLMSPVTCEPMEPLLVPNVMARRMISDHLQARTQARKAQLRAERRRGSARGGGRGGGGGS